jgi:hypothetical protein
MPETGQVGVVPRDPIGGPIGLSVPDEQEIHDPTRYRRGRRPIPTCWAIP